MTVKDGDVERIKALLAQDTLTQNEVLELVARGCRGGELPHADGWSDRGEPFWFPRTIQEWACDPQRSFQVRGRLDPLRRRSASLAAPGRVRRRRGRRPSTWDPSTRTAKATICSETPATIFDFESGEYIVEVLFADGGRMADDVPLLADHDRTTGATIGRAFDLRREGNSYAATIELGTNEKAEEVAAQIERGDLDAVSIGYKVHSCVRLQPGESAVVAGREFTNYFDRVLQLSTDWEIYEVSVVAIGADSTARIRSHQPFVESRGTKMTVVVHSRQSVSGRLSTRQAVHFFAQRAGVDTARHFAIIDEAGALDPRRDYRVQRDAEVANDYRQWDSRSVFRQVLEADGIQVRDMNPAALARAAFYNLPRSCAQRGVAFATTNLFAAMQGVAAAIIAGARDAAGDSTRLWVDETEVANYLEWPSLRLSGGELTLQAKGGLAQQLDLQMIDARVQVMRYSAQVTVDEVDLTNFLSGGSGVLPELMFAQMGAAARSVEIDLPYALLLSGNGPTMQDGLPLFDAGHANLLTGNLDDAGLSDVAKAIGAQTESGVNLNLRPGAVLAPIELEREARKRVREVWLDDQSTPAPAVLSDARLTNGVKDPRTGAMISGSSTTWFAASGTPGYGIQRQFLAGTNRQPVLRSGLLNEPGQYGMWFDVKHTVGVAAIGWQGLAKIVAA